MAYGFVVFLFIGVVYGIGFALLGETNAEKKNKAILQKDDHQKETNPTTDISASVPVGYHDNHDNCCCSV